MTDGIEQKVLQGLLRELEARRRVVALNQPAPRPGPPPAAHGGNDAVTVGICRRTPSHRQSAAINWFENLLARYLIVCFAWQVTARPLREGDRFRLRAVVIPFC